MPSSQNDTFPRMLGDVGGTNARFAIQATVNNPLAQHRSYQCSEYPDLQTVIEEYLSSIDGPRPGHGAIGIANPVTGDQVRMTNHHWNFSIRQLQESVGFQCLQIINDYTALAMALPLLSESDKQQIGGGSPRNQAAIALLGPGTGLGVSGLVVDGDKYVPLQGEGGHVTLPAYNDRERAIIALLHERYGHVSAERVLSGPGLVELYQACAVLQGATPEALSPMDVSQRALAGSCPVCQEALEVFCAMLGTVAADLTLILGALGGVYIGGGILPKLGDFFIHSDFRRRFEDKGRFSDYLSGIPTYLITAEYPSLLGAAASLEQSL